VAWRIRARTGRHDNRRGHSGWPFLASDEARYITGVTLPVDAGFLVK
jgi:NAD(P)-dependent dehydrogenase (short-subunit alcohol dehydrogenase family)